jgi:hypothetical protein
MNEGGHVAALSFPGADARLRTNRLSSVNLWSGFLDSARVFRREPLLGRNLFARIAV